MPSQSLFWCLCAFLLTRQLAVAQAPAFQWARSGSTTTAGMFPRAVAVDKAGNVFITGSCSGVLTLGTIRLTGHGKGDFLFLAKYSAAGSVLWAKSVLSSNDVNAQDMAVDGTGNVYVTGWLKGKAKFGPDSVASSGLDDNASLYLAKYDGAGRLQWVQMPHRVGGESLSYRLAVDAAGNACVSGEAVDVTAFGTATFPTPTSGAVLVKYAATGQLLWSQLVPLPGRGGQVALDAVGNAYAYIRVDDVEGAEKAFMFGGMQVPAGRRRDQLLAKFNPTGAPEWARRIPIGISGMAATGNGELVMTGIFTGDTLALDRRHPLYNPANMEYTMYLASFRTDGTVQWCRDYNWGAGQQVMVEGLAVDGASNTYVTGYVYNVATAGQPGTHPHLLVAKFDPTGKAGWVQQLAGSSHGEAGRAIAVDHAGQAVVMGQYFGSPVFGPAVLPEFTGGTIEQAAMFLTKLGASTAASATRLPVGKK